MTAIEVFIGVLAAFFVRDLLARFLDKGAWHMELPRANVGDDEVDPVNLTDEQRKLVWEEMKRDDQAARRRGAH